MNYKSVLSNKLFLNLNETMHTIFPFAFTLMKLYVMRLLFEVYLNVSNRSFTNLFRTILLLYRIKYI